MKSFAELRNETRQTGLQFLLTELEMALSFLDIADLSSDAVRRKRLLADSKKAMETVTHLLPRFDLTELERSTINSKLHQIRYRLQLHGTSVPTS